MPKFAPSSASLYFLNHADDDFEVVEMNSALNIPDGLEELMAKSFYDSIDICLLFKPHIMFKFRNQVHHRLPHGTSFIW